MIVKIVNQSPYPIPKYATALSAGMDINANIEAPIELKSLERVMIPTGLFIELPQGYEAQIRPRSGLAAKHGVTVANAPGTIDADYRGEIKVVLVNLSKESFTIKPGERIAQMVVAKYQHVEWSVVDKLQETLRGEGGFGSTGLGIKANTISVSKICSAKGKADIFKLYMLYQKTSGICTDSRKVEQGTLFFALKGENFDGNDFVLNALEAGAAYAVADNPQKIKKAKSKYPKRIIVVDDALKTLQQLARHHRLQFRIPVIALTGTNGKTTTKELIKAVLSTKYNVIATEGNLNNDIGVPLTLFKINSNTEIAVIEMGASHPRDISTLTSIVCPSFGLITTIGKAHLQGFGSLDGVMAAKGELYDNLQEYKKIAFVNTDNQLLGKMVEQRPNLQIVPYGITSSNAKISAPTKTNPYLTLTIANPTGSPKSKSTVKVKTKLIGDYNSDNVLAALCIGTYFAIPTAAAVKAIADYEPANNRSQMCKTKNNLVIKDTYNANPTSMSLSLSSFANLIPAAPAKEGKVLILGDMRELGKDAAKEHTKILEQALAMQPKKIYLVGEEFGAAYNRLCTKKAASVKAANKKVELKSFTDTPQLAEYLKENKLTGFAVFVKGSHSIGLERLFDLL